KYARVRWGRWAARRACWPPRTVIHETGGLSQPVASLRAGRPPGGDHPRVLLLAGARLAAPVALSQLAVRRSAHLRRAGQLREAVRGPRVPAERGHDVRVLVLRHLRP